MGWRQGAGFSQGRRGLLGCSFCFPSKKGKVGKATTFPTKTAAALDRRGDQCGPHGQGRVITDVSLGLSKGQERFMLRGRQFAVPWANSSFFRKGRLHPVRGDPFHSHRRVAHASSNWTESPPPFHNAHAASHSPATFLRELHSFMSELSLHSVYVSSFF